MSEELRGKRFPVLDHGFVSLIDWMGSDADVCAAARISYGKGTKSVSQDRDLIRYLYRNSHTSPFEMAAIKLHLRLPIDVARQWWRHRTASINEYSTRYSEAIDSARRTAPDAWRSQSTTNKQGSGGTITSWGWPGDDSGMFDHAPSGTSYNKEHTPPGDVLSAEEGQFQDYARRLYRHRLKLGVAREQARKDLPLATYTEAVWCCDLRNVLHLLGQRMTIPHLGEHEQHAQREFRDYADTIAREIVAPLFPLTWEAFEVYHLDAATLSALDIEAVRHVAAGCDPAKALADLFANRRERDECAAKLARLGLIREV